VIECDAKHFIQSLSIKPTEESPGSAGQGAGETPVGANLRKVPQKKYRSERSKGEKAR